MLHRRGEPAGVPVVGVPRAVGGVIGSSEADDRTGGLGGGRLTVGPTIDITTRRLLPSDELLHWVRRCARGFGVRVRPLDHCAVTVEPTHLAGPAPMRYRVRLRIVAAGMQHEVRHEDTELLLVVREAFDQLERRLCS